MKFLFLLLMCVACGGDDFRKVERLESFRVLGIVADTPEVDPATNLNLTVSALVSDVNGSDPNVSVDYELCIDPGISRGAPVTCDLGPSKVSGSFSIPISSFNNRTGLGVGPSFVVPPTILTGRSTEERFNGVGYLVIMNFKVGGEEYKMFKRILVSTRTPDKRNTNPQIGNILLNGSVIGAPPIDGDKISLTVGTPETYQVINADGSVETRTETFEVAWYTNSGKFDKPKARADETVEFQGDRPDFIMAVIRDERGGLDFRIFP